MLRSRSGVANAAGVLAGLVAIVICLVAVPGRSHDPCHGTQLNVLSSVEPGKYRTDPLHPGVIQEVAETFGGCIRVDGLTSGTAESSLEKGWAQSGSSDPHDVWLPSDSLWLNLLNTRLPAAHRAENLGSIASSTMVIAVTKSKAAALGWTAANPPGWAQIRLAARSGQLGLIKENARNSTSGALATLLAFRAGAGAIPLTPVQVDSGPAESFAADIEQAVTWYPDEIVGYLGKLAAATDRQPLLHGADAIILQQALFEQYPGLPTLLTELPIKGETSLADQPFVLRPDATPQVRELAAAFRTRLLAARKSFAAEKFGPPVWAADSNDSFRSGPVVGAVLDKWSNQLRRRVRMELLLDESGSLTKAGYNAMKKALGAALDRLSVTDHVSIVGFPDSGGGYIDPLSGQDPKTGEPLSWTPPQLAGRLDAIGTKLAVNRTESPIVEAVSEASQQLARQSNDANNPEVRAIVVLTDGKENSPSSQGRLKEILADLPNESSNLHIYVVPIGQPQPGNVLQRLAIGGHLLCVDNRPECKGNFNVDFDAVFRNIVLELGAK